MKKILLSLLAVLMLFAFVACDNPSGPSNVTPETGSGSTNNNGTSDNDTENNDTENNESEKIPVEETWVALTSLEGVDGAFRWDALHGMDEETQVLRFGNNEVVLEFYVNGELDGDSDTISTVEFLKIAVEQGFEINNTKTKIRIEGDVEYIKFSGTVEKSWRIL